MDEIRRECYEAVDDGDMRRLHYLYELLRGHLLDADECDDSFCTHAASSGNVRVLRFLHSKCGFACNAEAYEAAAMGGHVGVLRYLRREDCYTCATENPQLFMNAAVNGHLNCLRFLHDIGARCHPRALSAAVLFGRDECAQYLRELGCACTTLPLLTGTAPTSRTQQQQQQQNSE
jgi:hypothetical protein